MSNTQIIQGDCLDILPTLEENSIQCCITSPPYWGLRDYGVEGQLGLEETPEEYVKKLVAVFREVKRVLRKDGTLWLNLGDSYSGGGRGGDPKHLKGDNSAAATMESYKGIPAKNLIGIPWKVAFALQADGWVLRQDIIWAKPNPMPESVTDRCTKSHEYIFLLTKSAKYFYDAEAISEETLYACNDSRERDPNYEALRVDRGFPGSASKSSGCLKSHRFNGELRRNRRSVWSITTKPYKEAHFATFPPELPTLCIKAGSKIGDTILDPFAGAGTVGYVCEKLDRKFIGIELNPAYIKMAEDRIYNVQPLFAGMDL